MVEQLRAEVTELRNAILADIATLKKESHHPPSRAWDVAQKLGVSATIALVVMVISLHVRVSVIETSRFTRDDGATIRQQIAVLMSEMAGIDKHLHEIDEKLKGIEAKIR